METKQKNEALKGYLQNAINSYGLNDLLKIELSGNRKQPFIFIGVTPGGRQMSYMEANHYIFGIAEYRQYINGVQ